MATATATPAADAGLAGIGGGGDELGSLLGAGFDAATEGADESTDIEAGGAPEGAEPAEPITEESAPDTQPEPVVDQATTEATSEFQLTPDGKAYVVPKGKLPEFQAAKKFHDAVSQYYGSPQEAQTSYYQASDHRAMTNDFMSGDPNLIKGVLNHFATGGINANPLTQQRHQAAFAKMAELAPAMLQKINPEAYEGLVNGFMSKAVELAYDKAARSNNPDDFKRAQELDWGATGKYKTELPAPNPQAQQQTKEQAFEQRQAAAYNRDLTNFNSTALEGSVNTPGTKLGELSKMIDGRLAKVKAAYEPQAYADLKNGIHGDIISRMQGKGQNPDPTAADWWREHVQTWNGIIADYKTTWDQGKPGDNLQSRVQSYVQSFVNRANRYLPAVATARIGPATRAQVNRTNNGQFSPNGKTRQQSAPNTQPVNGQPQSRSDKFDSEFSAMFTPFKT